MLGAEDVVNEAISSSLGLPEKTIGSFADGTRESEAARQVYTQVLRALLRTAHWSFARKRAALELLADRTGGTIDPASGQAISTAVEWPWRFAYAWPIDGLQPRWLPWSGSASLGVPAGNIAAPTNPFANIAGGFGVDRPARFLVSTSDQFPIVTGQVDWANMPDFDSAEGVGLTLRRVVLTNVPSAELVYTMLIADPVLWDALFRQAMVAVLAERLAMPLIPDRKEAVAMRNPQIAIAKDAIREARVASANEAGFPQSIDHTPDWIRARRIGGYRYSVPAGDGPGYAWCEPSSFSFSDGSVY